MSSHVTWGLKLPMQKPGSRSLLKADSLLIVKSERKLYLLKAGEILRDFDIALGLMPEGHKEREGDFRTPEGLYYLDARNPNSDYFLSLHISYPNQHDIARARVQGVDPGGQIMIHGQPNEPKYSETRYESWDWTDGCIAVSNWGCTRRTNYR